jgi:nucleoside-diphosphate-sugar epimerase
MLIALTGATGFLGRRLIPALIAKGHAVRALTRRPQPPMQGVTWVAGDLSDEQALAGLVDGADAVVHAAAALRGACHADFDRPNRLGTLALVEAAKAASAARFILISSLAARAPDLSHYAASKRAAEEAVAASGLPCWMIVRPPAVYGPGDTATLPFFKAVKHGLAPRIGGGERPFSLIHVDDLISAIIFLFKTKEIANRLVEIDDGLKSGYTLPHLFGMIGDALAKRPVPLVVPVPLLRVAAQAGTAWCRLTGRAPMFTVEKLRELTAPDWVTRGPRLSEVSGWCPAIPAAEGLKATADWYLKEHWL